MSIASPTLPPIHPAWQNFLASHGAILNERQVLHYGDPAGERATAATGDIVADLSHRALLRVDGADAENFLQGQLSNDIRLVTDGRAQLSAYCNPKGRMFAIFLIARRGAIYYLQLPAELAEGVARRLRMFILRAKVNLDPAGPDWVAAGISGPSAESALRDTLGIEVVPAQPFDTMTHADTTIIRLPGPLARFELLAPVERMQSLWISLLSRQVRPVGAGPWEWLDIQSGLPMILSGTVEEFVPQMTNLEAVGGVSFTKGCYPGQEIVARMHYLGRLKQRMFLAHVESAPPVPGTPLHAPDLPGQSAGTVLAAQPSPGQGSDLLVVLQLSSADTGRVSLGDPSGPAIELRSLPYPLPAAQEKQ